MQEKGSHTTVRASVLQDVESVCWGKKRLIEQLRDFVAPAEWFAYYRTYFLRKNCKSPLSTLLSLHKQNTQPAGFSFARESGRNT